VLSLFENKAVHFKPGTQFEYCNSGYYLLGMIIERLMDMPYEQAVRKYIFEPLGMEHSGFDFIHLNSPDKATGYVSFDSSRHIPAVLMDSTVTYAAGGIYSTAIDLYQWAKAIAQKRLLSDSGWAHAFAPGLEHYGDGWWIDTLYGQKYVTHSGGLQGFMSSFTYFPDEDVTIILLNNFGNYGQSLWPINSGISAIVFGKP
jgi:CubicO group peptidase (beta-lactamase class C family)